MNVAQASRNACGPHGSSTKHDGQICNGFCGKCHVSLAPLAYIVIFCALALHSQEVVVHLSAALLLLKEGQAGVDFHTSTIDLSH